MKVERVLVVSTTNLGFNGITSVIMNYYRNIDRKKIQFDFAIGEEIHESIISEIESLGGKIYILPSRKKKTILFLRELKRITIKNKYRIVHVHGNSGTMYFDIHALKKAGVPVRIAHSHNSTCNHKLIHKILKNKLNKETTTAIACSKLAGEWLFNKDYTVLNNGIDIDRFLFNEEVRNNYRKKMNLEDKFVIGHIGHFSYQKNHEFLLNIFKEVHQRDKSSILILIGDGSLRGDIEKQISDLNLNDSVILLGKRQDAAELMKAMDVFVFPSRFEGLPVVLVEAQAAGLNCIVSDAITKESQITGRLNYLSLDSKYDLWADEILKYTEVYKRDDVKELIINSNYNIKNETRKLEQIYFKDIKA